MAGWPRFVLRRRGRTAGPWPTVAPTTDGPGEREMSGAARGQASTLVIHARRAGEDDPMPEPSPAA
jgi:hypothetical protein